jgi:hypothetical protein
MTAAMVTLITAITPPGVVVPQECYGDPGQLVGVLISTSYDVRRGPPA